MKPIIGILASIKIADLNNPYEHYYKIVDLYVERIQEMGGLAIALLSLDDIDVLRICDGFIIPGGTKINKNHYTIIKYAIDNNKPCLGICAGMQYLAMFDYLYNECLNANEDITVDNIYNKQQELAKKDIYILRRLENHGGKLVTGEIYPSSDNIHKSTHSIKIMNNSYLYDIYKKDSIDVISMHNYGIYNTNSLFKTVAISSDNVVEAIEFKDQNTFIMGVQFHIEVDRDNLILKRFIEECQKHLN